jgi:aminoglycoside phosphotransferase
VFDPQSCEPTLVVKLSRNRDWGGFLAWEAASLRAVHRARPGGFDSVPRLVCHDVHGGEHMLVQTALPGRVMRPSAAVRDFDGCRDLGLQWLHAFHRDTLTTEAWDEEAFTRLVDLPLRQLQSLLQFDVRAAHHLARTREAAEVLRALPLPLVFEHGDFGSPNLILTGPRQLGVIDWELAQPFGLPVVDVFFFLAFLSCARRHATTPEACALAFREAFVGRHAWAARFVLWYAESLGVPIEALSPLMMVCWARYLATLASRSECAGEAISRHGLSEWLDGERHWTLWQCAVEHASDLCWDAKAES